MSGAERRSILVVPASSTHMIDKAAHLKADQVLFDWEDAVAPSKKHDARRNILDLLNSDRKFAAKYLSIRINAISSSHFQNDLTALREISGNRLFSIVLPKVSSEEDLDVIERELGTVIVEVQIESAVGLINVNSIAAHQRTGSLSFGPLDYLADLGATTTDESDALFTYPLMKILLAGRASGKLVFDGPEVDIRNLQKFEMSASRVQAMGFDGKWVLHPDQIDLCNRIFTPNEEEYKAAKELIRRYETALAQGQGAFIEGDEMIDEASCRRAAKIVARAEFFFQD